MNIFFDALIYMHQNVSLESVLEFGQLHSSTVWGDLHHTFNRISKMIQNRTKLIDFGDWRADIGECMTGWLTDWITLLSDRLTDICDWPSEWLTDWLSDCSTNGSWWLTDWVSDIVFWVTDWMTLVAEGLTFYDSVVSQIKLLLFIICHFVWMSKVWFHSDTGKFYCRENFAILYSLKPPETGVFAFVVVPILITAIIICLDRMRWRLSNSIGH